MIFFVCSSTCLSETWELFSSVGINCFSVGEPDVTAKPPNNSASGQMVLQNDAGVLGLLPQWLGISLL